MKGSNNIKNWQYIITALIFSITGALVTFAYKSRKVENLASFDSYQTEEESQTAHITSDKEGSVKGGFTTTSSLTDQSTTSQTLTTPTGKFTIVETQKITADKKNAETGETVTFSAKLKNQGTKKKFLSHICFNHSGGVTFGCLLGRNFDPGEEIDISNTMMFITPNTYSVWITWSQDSTNFYRPINAGLATVYVE